LGRLAGAKVAHIESGLRSFNLLHPFPEEVTRLMVFRLSHLFFAPGAWAVANLRKYRGTVYDTKANTLVDSLRVAARNFSRCDVDVPNSQYAVASIHRFENVFRRSRLEWIVDELIAVSQTVPLLFILHLPTKKKLEKFGLMEKLRASERIELRPRYDYLNFIKLVSTSEFVISDGGSNQEECSYLGKPCLLFRDKTERQEGIGKNVVLSHYEHSRVEDFLARYRDLALAADPVDGSPAADIVDQLAPYYPHR
ncbi:MAG: UDP-N-acetyl glucosamine 2-epimerase, partial [Gammaproteobacteria bacterium]|nr:UDP-N-acetyl glucosamine 2-epimerase [Gammaproteobacteria bacterium]